MTKLTPRKTPCASCPYRKDVPSGVWEASEYEKLRGYDGRIDEQAMAGATGLFLCHQADGQLCAGWCGCHDMGDNLAVRLHFSQLDYSVFSYASPVPLFSSGNEAADHGEKDIEEQSGEARETVRKLIRIREIKGST